MVASLRERETSGELAAVSRFPPSPDGGFIEGDLGASGVPEEEMFPPSPDGGFIEGAWATWGADGARPRFHHLQMVASLRVRRHGVGKAPRNDGFHHLQMVASLRGLGHEPVDDRRGLFPPSPDGGFIEGSARRRRSTSGWAWFPPSPDGGFIEGSATAITGPHSSVCFHHLQMVASLRENVSDLADR